MAGVKRVRASRAALHADTLAPKRRRLFDAVEAAATAGHGMSSVGAAVVGAMAGYVIPAPARQAIADFRRTAVQYGEDAARVDTHSLAGYAAIAALRRGAAPAGLAASVRSIHAHGSRAGLTVGDVDERALKVSLDAIRQAMPAAAPSQARALPFGLVERICSRPHRKADDRTFAALLAFGFAFAARGGELAGVVASDIDEARADNGLAVGLSWRKFLAKTGKTEITSVEVLSIPGPPSTLMRKLLSETPHADGDKLWPTGRHHDHALFRRSESARRFGASWSTDAITTCLRQALEAVGVADAATYSAHSIRVGAATYASKLGLDMEALQCVGGWASSTVARGYARQAQATRLYAAAASAAVTRVGKSSAR